jgi:RNA polymerase sigma-70 factor (ECF subfamily)
VSSAPYEGLLPNVIANERSPRSGANNQAHERGKQQHADDDAAIEKVRNGNLEALALIFDRYSRSVYSIGLRILRNATEAQELVQDVFLHVSKKAHLYHPQGNGSFSSWLHHVAYTCALDRREYLNVRHFYDHLEIEEMTDSAQHQLSIETQAEIHEWNQILNAALSKLDCRQQQTLKMYFFEGFSLREISVKLDESLGNTRNLYYRGIQKLRIALERYLSTRHTGNRIYTDAK